MCGFLGEFCIEATETTVTSTFEKLLALSHHRGPDATETVSEKRFRLGFNRLAILDTSAAGNQPKVSPSKRFHLVFNGEIYNFNLLREEYELTNLKSTSDTEVLLHLIDRIGVEKTIAALNGMFAIAIVDTETNNLYLARDFAGIKPHFYGVSSQGVVFASQFDQIYKHPFFTERLELEASVVKEYFGFGYMQSPNTIYKNIFQVHPGELLKISEEGKIERTSICAFDKTLGQDEKHFSEADTKAYHSVLEEVVARQMVSDVPLASFLSGGIDSPLITAVAHQKNNNLEAYTVGVDDNRFDESEKARQYAEALGVKQHIIELKEAEIIAQVDEHFAYYPEPFGDYSSIPTYLICKKASAENKVMLSGDGGDELFLGYERMLQVVGHRRWFMLPFAIRRPLIKLSNRLGFTTSMGPYYYKTVGEWVLAKHLQIFPEKLDGMVPKVKLPRQTQVTFLEPTGLKKTGLMHWLRWNEFYGHLQRVLIKVDRASMGSSLEVRVPFLDKKSIQFSWNYIPKSFKSTKDLKSILKKCLGVHISEETIQTKKKGFTVPIDIWLKGALKKDVEFAIFERPMYGEEVMDTVKIKQFVREFYEDKHCAAWGVWHIYAWQKWAANHVSR